MLFVIDLISHLSGWVFGSDRDEEPTRLPRRGSIADPPNPEDEPESVRSPGRTYATRWKGPWDESRGTAP